MGNINPIYNSNAVGIRQYLARMVSTLSGSSKRNHYNDFGWPSNITFPQLKQMFERNSLASAAVEKTISKTWETNPAIWESEKPAESPDEALIADHFEEINLWRSLIEVDRRSMVGRYASFIMLLADGKPFHEPVEGAGMDITSLLGVIPCWEDQLKATAYVTDNTSADYGKPLMFEFTEAAVDNPQNHRSVKVHASRVIIWSEDGTLSGRSMLAAGFNDLIDAEKVKGAGGEGFWKTSRGAPIIEAPEGTRPSDVAKAMGIQDPKALHEALNKQLDDFNQGFDKGLMLGGMTAKPLQISLPAPEGFHNIPVNCFAASIQMPVRILLGNQTGERASTEDAREWAKVNMARRNFLVKPVIRSFINRLIEFGMLLDLQWTIGWDSLTDSTEAEKLDRAAKMSGINAQTQAGDVPAFTPDEIREAAGYEPLDLDETSPDRIKPLPTEQDLLADGKDDEQKIDGDKRE